ncbi:MAG: peptide deformylase, partial [Candidatus Pacebacteria bacterium]|nr:peptide deformylase [Candidatus Paceibacterota bacterium]
MKKILQRNESGSKVLFQKAKEVPIRDIKGLKIKKILKEMSATLKSQDDGVAIAAPQIGYGLRIFVVSGKIFDDEFITNRNERLGGEQPS